LALKLVVDPSLGKLARWLRLLGFDTHYVSHLSIKECLVHCSEQQRTFITLSKRALRDAGEYSCTVIQIDGSTIVEQLNELLGYMQLPALNIEKSRCSLCNGELSPKPVESMQHLVPKGSLLRFSQYYQCNNCNQPYWEGSHWQKIRKTLQAIAKPDNAN
jgi:uncharacterized protein with PIN domain